MEKKVRYIGKGHTIVNIDGENKKVLENDIITVKEELSNFLCNNDFKLVGSANVELLQKDLENIKTNIANEKKAFEKLKKSIEEKAQENIQNAKKFYDGRIDSNNLKLSSIVNEIEQDKIEREFLKTEALKQEEEKQKILEEARNIKNSKEKTFTKKTVKKK